MEINEKKIIYNEKQIFFFGAEILKGYCPVCVVTERLGSRRVQGRWGAGERAGARAERAWGAQVAIGRWALGERASDRSDRRASGRRTLGRRTVGARQQRAGRAGNGRQERGQARRGRAGARGLAHGARGARPAWAWPGRWMGAQAGPVLVHCAPGSVLARFLDPV